MKRIIALLLALLLLASLSACRSKGLSQMQYHHSVSLPQSKPSVQVANRARPPNDRQKRLLCSTDVSGV